MLDLRTSARCPEGVIIGYANAQLRQARTIGAEDGQGRPGPARRWPVHIAIVIVLDVMLRAGAMGVAVRVHRAPLQTVRIVAGPEDQNFLSDKRAQAEFARNGLTGRPPR